jgi:hypothetical protein
MRSDYYNKFVTKRILEHIKDPELDLPDLFKNGSNNYSDRRISAKFTHLKTTRFDFFFKTNGVDIPKCFKRSNSLRRQQHGRLFLRLVNFFMRHGLKLRTLNLFNRTLNTISSDLTKKVLGSVVNLHSWQQLFLTFTKLGISGSSNHSYINKEVNLQPEQVKKYAWRLEDQSFSGPTLKQYRATKTIYNTLFSRIKGIEPMYNFYVYRVAKKIYKNTRGKSGRYTFIWKYIAPYKRTYVTYY